MAIFVEDGGAGLDVHALGEIPGVELEEYWETFLADGFAGG